jgi:hypothetical protein
MKGSGVGGFAPAIDDLGDILGLLSFRGLENA